MILQDIHHIGVKKKLETLQFFMLEMLTIPWACVWFS